MSYISVLYQAAYGTSQNWCQQKLLLFAFINSKCNGKIKLTLGITKNIGNTLFEILLRDKYLQGMVEIAQIIIKK